MGYIIRKFDILDNEYSREGYLAKDLETGSTVRVDAHVGVAIGEDENLPIGINVLEGHWYNDKAETKVFLVTKVK